MVTRSLGPALLLALSVLACSGGAGEDTPDAESRALVLIVIDTLRGDRIGCMGSSVARTPHLDALAARGVRFSQAMTPVPVTLPAVASLLTGRLPMQHGVRDNEKFVLRSGEVTLAERFREAGWRTAAVVASSVLSRDRGLAEGFETYDDDFKGPYPVYNPKHKFANLKYATTRRRADTVTNLAVDAVRGFAGDPFFLFLHYFDVHTIYDPPPPYSSWHPGRAYDAEVSFVDAEIGRFLVTLQRERPDATVMVVSDHGEGLGEHGETLHGFLLYESTLHVVSIVAGPGLPQGAVREDPISLVDVEPTLAGWFGLPSVQPERDGRALSRDTPETDPAPLYAETMRTLVSYGWSELRAIRKGPHKAIFGPENELYDLSVDPAEVEDLGSVPPMDTLRGELETLIGAETRERVLASAVSDPDPERTEVLASLGYIGETETAKPSAQGSFPHPRDELEKWVQRQKNKDRVRAAALRLDAGDVQEAMEHFNTVLENEPDNTDALAGRGLARTRSGDAGGGLTSSAPWKSSRITSWP